MQTNDEDSGLGPQWAVTMFSFTNELREASRDPDQLLTEVVAAGLADAVEVDAAQHFAGFPEITHDEIASFRRAIDACGATPTMLGGYLDARLDERGPLSPDELREFLLAQVRAAAEMGFFGVRVGLGAVPPAVTERIVADLDRLDIRILEEVQAGAQPDSPAIDRSLEMRSRLGTDRLGFVFDASLVMAAVPVTWAASLISDGVPSDVIDAVEAIWRTREPTGYSQMQALIAPLDLPTRAIRRLEMPFRRFGCTAVADWADFFPQVTSVHLKYWDLEDADGRVSGPTAQLRYALEELGYDGFVCSEWGGHDWMDIDRASAFDMTRRHRALYDAVRE